MATKHWRYIDDNTLAIVPTVVINDSDKYHMVLDHHTETAPQSIAQLSIHSENRPT